MVSKPVISVQAGYRSQSTSDSIKREHDAYPNTSLLLFHWGSVDAPTFTPFNGDQKAVAKMIVNPDRIRVLAPGEPLR